MTETAALDARDRRQPPATAAPTGLPAVPQPSDDAGRAAADDVAARVLTRFYLTSDLRAATGLTRSHLDFYLREGLIVPTARTESGYLLFDDAELATLRRVIGWRQDGLGIREIRARLGRGT